MASDGWRPPVPRRQTTTTAAGGGGSANTSANGISSRDSPELHFSYQARSTFPLSPPGPPERRSPTIPAFALASNNAPLYPPPPPPPPAAANSGSRLPAPIPAPTKPYHHHRRPWGEDHILRIPPVATPPPSPPPFDVDLGDGGDGGDTSSSLDEYGMHHPRPTRTPSSYRDIIRSLHDAADAEADRTRPASTSPAPIPAPAVPAAASVVARGRPAARRHDELGSGFWRPKKAVRFSEVVEDIE
ncbi:hypothetical protein SLS62_009286 [Diatrype stigma]|uniref:Uncharacterized protein n=1 Tax=Diatrype stigma TaxID=117547 RepID=A0AAN9UN01_9PEZI